MYIQYDVKGWEDRELADKFHTCYSLIRKPETPLEWKEYPISPAMFQICITKNKYYMYVRWDVVSVKNK